MSHDAKIDLACVDHDYRALLFKGETEIMYSNQIGGTCCSHSLIEGFFVLLNGAGPDEKDDPFYLLEWESPGLQAGDENDPCLS